MTPIWCRSSCIKWSSCTKWSPRPVWSDCLLHKFGCSLLDKWFAKLFFIPWAIIVILWIIHDLRREGDHWSINMELTCTLQLLFWSVYMANFIGTSMFKSFSNSNKCSFHGQPLSWSSMISPLGSTLQRNFKSLIFFYFSVLWQFHLFLPIRGTPG